MGQGRIPSVSAAPPAPANSPGDWKTAAPLIVLASFAPDASRPMRRARQQGSSRSGGERKCQPHKPAVECFARGTREMGTACNVCRPQRASPGRSFVRHQLPNRRARNDWGSRQGFSGSRLCIGSIAQKCRWRRNQPMESQAKPYLKSGVAAKRRRRPVR
jgi:hypothetical protein